MANVVVTAGKRIAFFDAKKAYEFVTAYVVEHHILPAVTVDRVALTEGEVMRLTKRWYLVTTSRGTYALSQAEYLTFVAKVATKVKTSPIGVRYREGGIDGVTLGEYTSTFHTDVKEYLEDQVEADLEDGDVGGYYASDEVAVEVYALAEAAATKALNKALLAAEDLPDSGYGDAEEAAYATYRAAVAAYDITRDAPAAPVHADPRVAEVDAAQAYLKVALWEGHDKTIADARLRLQKAQVILSAAC